MYTVTGNAFVIHLIVQIRFLFLMLKFNCGCLQCLLTQNKVEFIVNKKGGACGLFFLSIYLFIFWSVIIMVLNNKNKRICAALKDIHSQNCLLSLCGI